MDFGLIVIGIYLIVMVIYVLVVAGILLRIRKSWHSKRKEDNNANN